MTGYDILLESLASVLDRKTFRMRADEVISRAFDQIFASDALIWKRTSEGLTGKDAASAHVILLDANDTPVDVEVFLYQTTTDLGWGGWYVVLGQGGPTKNDADPRVVTLFENVFGVKQR